jgi:hypothetical protein
MNLFNRRYEKLGNESKNKEERREELRKLKSENLGVRDIFAIIIAMFQLILPFAIIIVAAYFLIILFITKVWMA